MSFAAFKKTLGTDLRSDLRWLEQTHSSWGKTSGDVMRYQEGNKAGMRVDTLVHLVLNEFSSRTTESGVSGRVSVSSFRWNL